MTEYTRIESEDELSSIDLPEPGENEMLVTIVTDEFVDRNRLKPAGLDQEDALRIIVHPSGERGGGISLEGIVKEIVLNAFTIVILLGQGAVKQLGSEIVKRNSDRIFNKLSSALSGHSSQGKWYFQCPNTALTLIIEAPVSMEPANVREVVGLAFDWMASPGDKRYRRTVYDREHGALITMYEH
jgi:hypothetical protein